MKHLIFIVFIFSFDSLFAKNNNISIGFNGYKYYNVLDYSKSVLPIAFTTIEFNRKINRNFAIKTKYSFDNGLTGNNLITLESSLTDTNSIGKIESRLHYHFFDISLGYSFKVLKKDKLHFYLGPSFAYGENSYKFKLVLAPGPMPDIVYKENREIYEGYLGGIFGINYDYLILKEKLNIGVSATSRYYIKQFPFSIYYGMHIGYNF